MIHNTIKIFRGIDSQVKGLLHHLIKCSVRKYNKECKVMKLAPRPVVISGPSGAGKSTLLQQLMTDFGQYIGFCVSHTTRNPRPGEVNGKDYHFVTTDTFLRMIKANEFIEYVKYSNNYYGTSKKAVTDVQRDGKICILDLELEGVKKMKQSDLNPRFVFIKPPGTTIDEVVSVLRQRLEGRGTESSTEIENRLKLARELLKYESIKGNFDATIVTSDKLHGYECLKNLIIADVNQE